ncbi:MAG: hypothetical protein JSU66_08840, partial [Deltaproteobacteria bacterium]
MAEEARVGAGPRRRAEEVDGVRGFLAVMILIGLAFGVLYGLGDGAAPEPRSDADALWGADRPESAATARKRSARRERRAPAETKAPAPDAVAFYQYVDERGSVRIVDTLDQVPPAWRDRAGRVEVDAASIARYDAPKLAARGSGTPERRAFAYTPDRSVVVYTTSWCGYCRKTLAYLDA